MALSDVPWMAYGSVMSDSRPRSAQPFGELIRRARKSRDWSRERLANESGVGLRTLGRWESGETEDPSHDQVSAVVDALGIPLEDALAALGWLPEDKPPSRTFTDPDLQALWDIAERRGWSTEIWEALSLAMQIAKSRIREGDDSA